MMLNKKLVLGFHFLLILSLSLVWASPAVAAPLTGAIFTTDVSCGGVNFNVEYPSKEAVYIDGGPRHLGAAGLPEGDYYVQVTSPDGILLGTSVGSSNATPVHVNESGEFEVCYQLWAIVMKASDRTTGYDDTPNPGGEYKVWVSSEASFPNDSTKTDNFKVATDKPESGAYLSIIKFYDANANGINDDGIEITGWWVNVLDGFNKDYATPITLLVSPDQYIVSEYKPVEENWMPTTLTPRIVNVGFDKDGDQLVEFGNLCLGAGGGMTLGFWSNKKGQALFGDDDLALMVSLNLRNADGSHFDPASYSEFRTWLLSGNATNMAYMLSVQMAAMQLNVLNGKVSGDALIYAPGTSSASNLGFATIADVLAEANNELGLHGLTLSDSQYRGYQQDLKNALDKANNNMNFVQPTPCPFSFNTPPDTYENSSTYTLTNLVPMSMEFFLYKGKIFLPTVIH